MMTSRPSHRVSRAIVAFIGLLALTAPAAFAADAPLSTLTVTASGEVVARPDVARVTAAVVAEAKTTADALAAADRAAAALLAEVEAAGIPKADVATSDFSVTPIWSNTSSKPGEPARIAGYSVTNGFNLTVRRLADLGPLLERLVAKGSNSVSGIAFDVSDADRRRDEARVAAVRNARARAELLADAAGLRIERVLTLSEGAAEPAPMPRVFARAAKADAVPVEPGSRSITADVTMTFEVAPRR